MAKLPPSVQRQVEAADALLNQANAPAGAPETEMAEGTTPEPANSEADANGGDQAAAQAPAPAPEPRPAHDVWEQRYKSLQGLFNQKVPELQRQNEELQASLKGAIERLNQAATKPAPATQSAADPRDIENFGQDLVDMVQRQTRDILGSMAAKVDAVVADYDKRLAQLEQSVKGAAQSVAVTAEEVFFSKLSAAVPDWEQINTDDRFLAWLGEEDPVYGQPRQAALNSAQQAQDVRRVANVFNAFKATLPAAPKPRSLEKQISPGTGAAASTPTAAAAAKVYSSRDVQAFYDAVRRGEYRGREAEAAQLEQVINQALQDGRIR